MITKRFIVQGKVQGVFFRSNVRKKALELGIKGYAKNLENGDVEVLAYGKSEEIAALTQYILSNPGLSRVEKITNKAPLEKNHADFEVL